MDHKKRTHAISSLRRGSYKWPPRWEAEKRSHVGRGEYLCESCGWITKKKNTAMDHVLPVVNPETGYIGLDDYADRLYVEANGWQRLCNDCHSVKTKEENKIRKKTAKDKKST